MVFSYLLRYVDDPAATVAELARCLRPGGTLASLDFYVPPHPVWHASWQLYTRAALPVLGGLTGGQAWRQVGEFLGPSISTHYKLHPLAEHVAAWRAGGLEEIEVRLMSLGGGLVMAGRKRMPAAGAAPDAQGAQITGKPARTAEKGRTPRKATEARKATEIRKLRPAPEHAGDRAASPGRGVLRLRPRHGGHPGLDNAAAPAVTMWHLSYVVFGARSYRRSCCGGLGRALLAFFLAVGMGRMPSTSCTAGRWAPASAAGS